MSIWRWSLEAYRKIVFYSAWTEFEFVDEEFKVEHLHNYRDLEPGESVHKWLCMVRDARKNANLPVEPVPDSSKPWLLLEAVMKNSPKLRALLANLGEQVIKQELKALVWVMYPGVQLFLEKCLNLLNLKARSISSNMETKDRAALQKLFNAPSKDCQVLILSFVTTSDGLNLHHQSPYGHFFDTPTSVYVKGQCVGRNYRVGQTRPVSIIEYTIRGTFHLDQVLSAFKKAVPTLIAELDSSLFRPEEEGINEEGNGDSSGCKLGEWVHHNGALYPASDEEVKGLGLPILKPHELCFALMEAARGETIQLD